MIFAILFVLAFIIGLVTYVLTDKWLMAVIISIGLFVITTLSDTEASDRWLITFVFGLPIVFVASLFGAYVVQLRRGLDLDESEAKGDDVSRQSDDKSTE